jgi:hypothetical protein
MLISCGVIARSFFARRRIQRYNGASEVVSLGPQLLENADHRRTLVRSRNFMMLGFNQGSGPGRILRLVVKPIFYA